MVSRNPSGQASTSHKVILLHTEDMANGSTILERVLRPDRGGFSPELAKHVLEFDFPPSDHERYEVLSAKASEGALTEQERMELEEYLDVNDLLTVMKAKAQASLKPRSKAA